VPNVSGQ
jgi:hypothetical protein